MKLLNKGKDGVKSGISYFLAVGAIIIGACLIIVFDFLAIKNAGGDAAFAVIVSTVVSVAGTVLAYGGLMHIIDRSSPTSASVQNEQLRSQNKELKEKNEDLTATNEHLRTIAPRLIEASFNPKLVLFTGRLNFYDYYKKVTSSPAEKTGILERNVKAKEEVLHSVAHIECEKSIYLDLAKVKIKTKGNTVYVDNDLPIECRLNTEGNNSQIVKNVLLHLTKEEWEYDRAQTDHVGKSKGKTLEQISNDTFQQYHEKQSGDIIERLKLINEDDARQFIQHARMHLQHLLGSSGYHVEFRDNILGAETLISFVEKHKQIAQ